MVLFFRRQMLLLLIVLFKLTESDRKSKRIQESRSQAPIYELFSSDNLPSDLQVTTFLYKGEPKIFNYWSTINNGPLSVTIITCSSPIQWSIGQNSSTVSPSDGIYGETTVTTDMDTQHFTAFSGNYYLRLTSEARSTYVHIYISTESGGPQALQNSHQKLRLQKRQRRKRLTIQWEPSLVDPQGTYYCLTVNIEKSYKSLCSVQAEKFDLLPPKMTTQPIAASQTVIRWQPHSDVEGNLEKTPFPLIACVGRKTKYTVSNLSQGQTYYFDLFATNKQSNLTYFFGSTSTKFDNRVKPISLRDGKSAFANLKKLDGKVVFRFKVGRHSRGNPLNIFITACDVLVYVEVLLAGKPVVPKRSINKRGSIIISAPVAGARYHVKVLASNKEIISRNSGIEILATTKPTSKTPLPNMPPEMTVKEYETLRKCDSVTIGWLGSPDGKFGHYCIVAMEGQIRETDDYGVPNQCGLENRLRKSVNFDVKYCKNIAHDNTRQAITEQINYLRPGKSYIIQVTVKKHKGKSLAYDLVQVHTRPSCHKH